MLYKQAEGERQRRPRPIQRPQCNSSHMPSIPMRCVKVELAESSGWTFLWRATLNTHRQSSDQSLWCPATATVFSTLLRVCVLRKCEIPGLMGRTMSSQISQVHIFHLYPELNRAFLYYVRPEIIHLFQQQSHFSSVLSGQLFFSVTSTKKQNCPSARSLTNHRCWLRLRVGLPDPSASLVRRTLPMTLHFILCPVLMIEGQCPGRSGVAKVEDPWKFIGFVWMGYPKIFFGKWNIGLDSPKARLIVGPDTVI